MTQFEDNVLYTNATIINRILHDCFYLEDEDLDYFIEKVKCDLTYEGVDILRKILGRL